MIPSADVSLVRRNVATGGGTLAAICLICSSDIGPGPLGILATRPIAEAPWSIAILASSMLCMQQILILGFIKETVTNAESYFLFAHFSKEAQSSY
jgi:hypothetical protein